MNKYDNSASNNGGNMTEIPDDSKHGPDSAGIDIEQQKLKFEREKFEREQLFEQKKLESQNRNEIYKTIISTLGTLITVIVSVAIVFITISNNLQIQNMQGESELQLAKIKAQDDFKLKAAELILDAQTPNGTLRRAQMLRDLFDDQFSSNFTENFDPHKYESKGYDVKTQQW
jgi:hypothetical protein